VKIIIPADTLITDTLSLADSVALDDTLGLLSDSLNIIKADTINPIYQKSLYGYSSFINKGEYLRRPYTNTGDILSYTPFFFNVSHGLSGYPDNAMIYGAGSDQNTFMINGININDYSDYPIDLNRIQTEYIDSAEIIPLPRSFVYGISNTAAAVNLIGKDFLSISPYTRIKYYEGPFGEGFVDGMFNSIIFSRMNLFLGVTNKKVDRRYVNTDFSKWNGTLQLKYLFNNKINFISGYQYSNTSTGVSGGIDVKNLVINENEGFFDALYDEISAPVLYPSIRYNSSAHSLFLKTLARWGTHLFTDLSFYYRFNRIELNNPDPAAAVYLNNLFRNKISGVSVKQDFNYSLLNFKILGSFESADINNSIGFPGQNFITREKFTNASAAGVVTLSLLDSILLPSAFYKINSEHRAAAQDYSGYGADIKINLPFNSGFYAGYSEFSSRWLVDDSKQLQTGFSYNTGNFNAGLSYFSREGDSRTLSTDTVLNLSAPFYYPGNIKGLSFNVDINIHNVLLEGKIDYYREANKDLTDIIPSVFINGGIYYKDSLFQGNLDLKAGFNLIYSGRRNLNLGPEYFAIYKGQTAGPDFRLDFFLSGEIQNSAIIYFQWENILDRKYFIIPFYPMPPRGIRFGVAWELFN